ncbi:ATP-binding cassette transporter snq2 [Diatrype stigma]|uniref:ATP-binding cassette transporter snq2 n=1 Tax=Diatrype stigma TaxID=117547 RepID=A0AAN9UZS0_9PEZI
MRNLGIFLAFCVSNWALVYFFIYTVRVRGWKFGFDRLFGGLGKALDFLAKKKTPKSTTKTATTAAGKKAQK